MFRAGEAMWDAGADGINFDTADAAGDADFLAVPRTVRRLRAALIAEDRPTRPARVSTFTGGPMDTKAPRPTATYPDLDPAWPLRALQDLSPTPFWLDSPLAPAAEPPLTGSVACDLAVVGGGYAGLWTALLAKERDPSRDVVVVEAGRVGRQASGRNGGFCMATITHGLSNTLSRWPDDLERLTQAGIAELAEMRADVERHGIDCDWQDCGEMYIATEPWQIEGLKEEHELAARAGANHEYLDQEAVRAEVDSPSFLAAVWDHDCAMLDPARLAWGLARVCREKGVRIYEGTPATALRRAGAGVVLDTPAGEVRARQAMLATNAFPALLKRLRPYTIPVYDHALMTEPLNAEQLAAIGWQNRQGLGDAGLFFHYFRISEEKRILWGGWDGIYHWRNGIRPEFDQRQKTFVLLSRHFFTMFPQLQGLRFTHGWGGTVDVCSNVTPFYGTALGGRVAYALGFTGQGVGAVRFAASVCLDLLAGEHTERTALPIVGSKPVPWPPEPLRSGVIWMTQRSMQRAHDSGGKSDLWLRTLEKFKLGFDT
jgi:glycine/D-amino acid oxidase-like deaminating enzyme